MNFSFKSLDSTTFPKQSLPFYYFINYVFFLLHLWVRHLNLLIQSENMENFSYGR